LSSVPDRKLPTLSLGGWFGFGTILGVFAVIRFSIAIVPLSVCRRASR
jgi:hypothetical protein